MEMNSADVPLAVDKQYLDPRRAAQASSNCSAYLPPIRFQRPLRSTSIHTFSSLSRICGQDGKRFSRRGAPPSSAGLSTGLGPAANAVADAAPRKTLRVFLVVMIIPTPGRKT